MQTITYTITKADIAKKISDKLGLSIASCEIAINSLLKNCSDLILEGHKLQIKNFGNFEKHTKASRPGQNIAKKQTIVIPSKTVIRFVASRQLRQNLNS